MNEHDQKIYEHLAKDVLSSWLFHNTEFDEEHLKLLDLDLFVDQKHKDIAQAIHELRGKQQTINPINVCCYLRDNNKSSLEIESFLLKLRDQYQHFSFWRNINRLQNLKTKDKLRPKLKQVFDAFNNDPTSLGAAIKELQEEVKLNVLQTKESFTDDVTTLKTALQQLEENRTKVDDNKEPKLRSCNNTLDEKAYLFERGTLTTIAARPGVGKTTFAINLIANNLDFAEAQQELPPAIGIVSLEARNKDTLITLIAIKSGVDLIKVRNYFNKQTIDKELEERIKRTQKEIADCNLLLNDNPNLNITGICEWVKKCLTKYDLKFVVIDHLQLVKPEKDRREENLNLDVGGVSRELKKLALEHDICVIALSQLNRKMEMRGKESKKPMLSDLRDSGGIEQDSDVVIILTQPENNEEDKECKDCMNLFILKNRRGTLAEFGLRFDRNKGKFF